MIVNDYVKMIKVWLTETQPFDVATRAKDPLMYELGEEVDSHIPDAKVVEELKLKVKTAEANYNLAASLASIPSSSSAPVVADEKSRRAPLRRSTRNMSSQIAVEEADEESGNGSGEEEELNRSDDSSDLYHRKDVYEAAKQALKTVMALDTLSRSLLYFVHFIVDDDILRKIVQENELAMLKLTADLDEGDPLPQSAMAWSAVTALIYGKKKTRSSNAAMLVHLGKLRGKREADLSAWARVCLVDSRRMEGLGWTFPPGALTQTITDQMSNAEKLRLSDEVLNGGIDDLVAAIFELDQSTLPKFRVGQLAEFRKDKAKLLQTLSAQFDDSPVATSGTIQKKKLPDSSGNSNTTSINQTVNQTRSVIKATPLSRPPKSRSADKEKLCYKFAEGKCTYGDNCRFRHDSRVSKTYCFKCKVDGHRVFSEKCKYKRNEAFVIDAATVAVVPAAESANVTNVNEWLLKSRGSKYHTMTCESFWTSCPNPKVAKRYLRSSVRVAPAEVSKCCKELLAADQESDGEMWMMEAQYLPPKTRLCAHRSR